MRSTGPRFVDPFGQSVASGVRSRDRRGPVLRNVISHLAHVIRRTLFRRHGFGRRRERLSQSQCYYFKPKTATDKKTTIWQEQNVYHKYLPVYSPPSTVNFACPSMPKHARKVGPGGLQRVVLEHFKRQPAKWSQEASRGSFWKISGASPPRMLKV